MKEQVIKRKRAIAIVLALCIYFTLLSLISFLRASGEYKATGENIVSYKDFTVEAADGRAWLDTNGLHFNDTENTEKKFSAMISFEEFQQIQVEFFVECPQEYAGTAVLHVDLCTDGYDTDAQEFMVMLTAGRNKITQVIDKGNSAPKEGQFRIFCLDSVQCDISDLNVRAFEEISYTGKIKCAAVTIAVLLLLLLLLGIITRSGAKESEKSGIGSTLEAQNEEEPVIALLPSAGASSTPFVVLLLLILFLPSLLGLGTVLTGKTFDVALYGYAATTQKPVFSLQSFWNGQFQSDYSAWYQENFQPHGVLTKNYGTLQYNFFQLGNGGRIIGKNHDIFEPAYINSELCINGASDFSQLEAQNRAKEYIAKLELLQDKLAKHGKTLYIVMTPSKADFHRENIPDSYVALSDQNAISGEDYVAGLLNKSDIPHLICVEMKETLSYPAFYHSGTHWSRTFEQETFATVINDLSSCTGRIFPRIEVGDVTAQDAPYWRDADLFDLLNIWNPYTETYYQYDLNAVYPDNCENLGVLFQGTSFSDGFYNCFTAELPLETCFYINRASYLQGANETRSFHSFGEIDLTFVFSQIDAVIIELLPAEIENYSNGFVEHLLSFLDTFSPVPPDYMTGLDTMSSDAWDTTYFKGLHIREESHVWTSKASQVTIQDPLIRETGLELNYTVPNELFVTPEPVHVEIYINNVRVFEGNYHEMWEGSVMILPDQFPPTDDNVYKIKLVCDSSFIPAEVLGTADTRELSLALRYIGRAR